MIENISQISPRDPGSPRGAAHRAVPGEDLRVGSGGFKGLSYSKPPTKGEEVGEMR